MGREYKGIFRDRIAVLCFRAIEVLIIGLLLVVVAVAQQTRSDDASSVAPVAPAVTPTPAAEELKPSVFHPCNLPGDTTNAATALTTACERFFAVRTKFPDYLCQEEMVRHSTGVRRPPDVISVQVRFVDGRESYTDAKVNGQPLSTSLGSLPGLMSFGEFGSLLRTLFDPQNKAEFSFRKDTKLDSRRAFLYEFHVARENNKSLWSVRIPRYHLYPGYKGRLWLDATTAQPLRVEMRAVELPRDFPLPGISLSVDYAEVPLGDGSKFVLPVASYSRFCGIGARYCYDNKTTFTHCRKFGAEHRIVPSE